MMKKLTFGIRIILGIVFVYASIDKILHPADFAEAVFNYQILPDALINLTALILPYLELILGISLILGIALPGSVFLANLLLIVFMVALIFNLARGLNIHCGCFSAKAEVVEGNEMIWTVLRDSVFLLMGIFLFLSIYFERKNEVYRHSGFLDKKSIVDQLTKLSVK